MIGKIKTVGDVLSHTERVGLQAHRDSYAKWREYTNLNGLINLGEYTPIVENAKIEWPFKEKPLYWKAESVFHEGWEIQVTGIICKDTTAFISSLLSTLFQ